MTAAADVAVLDMLKAVMRDADTALTTTTAADLMPGRTRILHDPHSGLCRAGHAVLRHHPRFELRHCLGPAGHVVSVRLTPTEVRGHLLALARTGFVVRLPAAPNTHPSMERWSWVAPIGVAARNTEAMENAVFADMAALYDRPEAS